MTLFIITSHVMNPHTGIFWYELLTGVKVARLWCFGQNAKIFKLKPRGRLFKYELIRTERDGAKKPVA